MTFLKSYLLLSFLEWNPSEEGTKMENSVFFFLFFFFLIGRAPIIKNTTVDEKEKCVELYICSKSASFSDCSHFPENFSEALWGVFCCFSFQAWFNVVIKTKVGSTGVNFYCIVVIKYGRFEGLLCAQRSSALWLQSCSYVAEKHYRHYVFRFQFIFLDVSLPRWVKSRKTCWQS